MNTLAAQAQADADRRAAPSRPALGRRILVIVARQLRRSWGRLRHVTRPVEPGDLTS